MANEKIFESKAEQYSDGRPSYAPEMIYKLLNDVIQVDGNIADIGSGTGVLTKEFVKKGYEIYAVEPNEEMRKKAEQELSAYSNFHSVDAFAENTGLKDNSISLITVASAFHWFDVDKFKQECIRILTQKGVVCIIFNVRVFDDFSKKQSEICERYCNGFESLTHGYDKTVGSLENFFESSYATYRYDFPIEYTKQKFLSRSLSSSYAPLSDSENYKAFVREITALLDEAYETDTVKIANQTVMFVGRVK